MTISVDKYGVTIINGLPDAGNIGVDSVRQSTLYGITPNQVGSDLIRTAAMYGPAPSEVGSDLIRTAAMYGPAPSEVASDTIRLGVVMLPLSYQSTPKVWVVT